MSQVRSLGRDRTTVLVVSQPGDAKFEEQTNALVQKLREAGVRLTTPRRAVIEALLVLQTHPTAEDLVTEIARHYPDIHRSTIYRTLDALSDAGLVNHVHLGHGGAAYHLAGTHDQLHVVCSSCDAVGHADSSVLEQAKVVIEESTGFTITPGHFAIPAVCSKCRAQALAAD